MSDLVIIESAAHARWVAANRPSGRVVAITAVAADTLVALGVPHAAAAEFVSTRPVASVAGDANRGVWSLAKDLERFAAQRHSWIPGDEGPGFLSAHCYFLQYSVLTILTRWWIVTEIIRQTRAASFDYLDTPVHFWFAGDGYVANPWTTAIHEWAASHGVVMRTLTVDDDVSPRHQGESGALDRRLPARLVRASRRIVTRLSGGTPAIEIGAAERRGLEGMNVLAVGGLAFDWQPVGRALAVISRVSVQTLPTRMIDGRAWNCAFEPRTTGTGRDAVIAAPSPIPDAAETEALVMVFDEWIAERHPVLPLLELDVLPALRTHLRAQFVSGPALLRHADAIAARALDIARPDVVTFFAMPWLATARLAFQARKRSIPTVCYQHGGTYGTHRLPKQDLLEQSQADCFLTYGPGVQADPHAWRQTTARHVPVGSARISAMTVAQRPDTASRLDVLWIGEISTRNTSGGDFQTEDTRRYRMQTAALQVLAVQARLRVTFRPYPGKEPDGTTSWLRRQLPAVAIDTSRPMQDAIRRSHVVITDSSSGTAWNEVLALGSPLVLFCDPDQTPLVPSFEAALDAACIWCRDEDALQEQMRRLAADPEAFVTGAARDTRAFLDQYVVPQEAPDPVHRVLAFLAGLPHHDSADAPTAGTATIRG